MTDIHCFPDIDECATASLYCSADATCKNTKGSYKCTCKQGFSGDGKECEGDIFAMLLFRKRFVDTKIVSFIKWTIFFFRSCKSDMNDNLIIQQLRFFFQILMSVLEELPIAVRMPFATIPRGHTAALVNLDTMEMETIVPKVILLLFDFLCLVEKGCFKIMRCLLTTAFLNTRSNMSVTCVLLFFFL